MVSKRYLQTLYQTFEKCQEGLEYPLITLQQLEDIQITQYTAFLFFNSSEKAFAVLGKGEEIECPTSDELGARAFVLDLDFKNKIEAIRLVIKDHIVDDIIIPIEFIEADKEQYYAKIAAAKRSEFLQKAAFSVATGESLLNVKFQPVSDDFSYAKVELRDSSKVLLGRYKSEPDIFFVVIKDLAFGNYTVIVKEYNEKNEELIASDEIPVHLAKPNYGGKPTVVI